MVNYILSKSPNGLFLIFERSVQFDFTIRQSYYIKHIYYSYVNSKQHMGWPSDGQTFISDDLGAGTLGILYVLISSINGRKTNDDIFL